MSSKSFENYARVAAVADTNNNQVAGRYNFQAAAQRRIIPDVVRKLGLSSDDRLLEIGCGPGNLLLPLSHLVERATGIDNEAALGRLAARCGGDPGIELLPGNFLTMPLPEARYSKILVYSVIQYVGETGAALFLRRAIDLLEPGGKLLIGDLPNRDKKRRYAESARGRAGNAQWHALISAEGAHPMDAMPRDEDLVAVDDRFVLGLAAHARECGCESYLLSQPDDLPFGNTREDLLIVSAR
ncbi:MAG TPA: class I SAM-dependent methyltransferase [Burkholderiaceae bacterium]